MDISPQEMPAAGEKVRGRKRTRDVNDSVQMPAATGTQNISVKSSGGQTKKRRRRSRKGLEKKFECSHEGCGKSYSRAEHLYRHQLNHSPKEIYRCDFPECGRTFVRQDLCIRHRERHTAHGSTLQRKDAIFHYANPQSGALQTTSAASQFINTSSIQVAPQQPHPMEFIPTNPQQNIGELPIIPVQTSDANPGSFDLNENNINNNNNNVVDPFVQPPVNSQTVGVAEASHGAFQMQSQGIQNTQHLQHAESNNATTANTALADVAIKTQRKCSVGSNGDGIRGQSSFAISDSSTSQRAPSTRSSIDFAQAPTQIPFGPPLRRGSSQESTDKSAVPQQWATQIPYSNIPGSVNSYPHQDFTTMTSIAPSPFAQMGQQTATAPPFTVSDAQGLGSLNDTSADILSSTMADPSLQDAWAASFSIPVFGEQGYNRSPFAMADDFAAWLFNLNTEAGYSAPSPLTKTGNIGPIPSPTNSYTAQVAQPYPSNDVYSNYSGDYSNQIPPHNPMAVRSMCDQGLTSQNKILSEAKRQELLDMIINRFNESEHSAVKKRKEDILEGDRDADDHILSLRSMQTYIGSYWYHFHSQMPILHRPTFNADKTENCLLLAIMCIGASCLDKIHGLAVTTAAADFANFVAWHLRWEVFMDADFRPPAKLWVFQTLLLLEIYEKLFATRALHERGHIHHATTLTLMRRGSSLIGRSAYDSPPSMRNGESAASLSRHPSNSPDEWWTRWITNEATRRAAFAAFVMDALHATMFGHSAVMVAHEMRLPLPCDEALWTATSGTEVGRVEASLQANGVKPVTFLDGLKKTLNGQSVHTNSFGRTVLMAGLLSVAWHMNQRDLQVSSLGVSQALGGRDRWRGALTRAFDFWRRDFDESLVKSGQSSDGGVNPFDSQLSFQTLEVDNLFESRIVLHHLAHIAMHVDIVDCQIFAGVARLLGRSITPCDYKSAQRRMKENWAPSARARDAVFYALKFLVQVLVPGLHHNNIHQTTMPQQTPSPQTTPTRLPTSTYSARDDFLLNRPWVLYFSALVVWAYGYALEGPLRPFPQLPTPELQFQDLKTFLQGVGGVNAPDDLIGLRGRNRCVGLLCVLRDDFSNTRWELLHEAARMLNGCVTMLRGPG